MYKYAQIASAGCFGGGVVVVGGGINALCMDLTHINILQVFDP